MPATGTARSSRVARSVRTAANTPAAKAKGTAAAKSARWGKEPKVDDIKKATAITEADFVTAQKVLTDYSTGPNKSAGGGAGTKDAATGAWSRGLLQVKQEHLNQGSVFTIYSGHNSNVDAFNHLKLRMRATPPNQSYPQEYDLMTFGGTGLVKTNPGKGKYQFESVLKYYLSDAELAGAIATAAPTISANDALKNAEFAIHGNWQSGHNWGDFGRSGIFPMTMGAGVRGAKPEAVIVVGLPPNQQKVELDITVPISAARKKLYPALDTKHAVFVSHLEAEGKARVPLTRFAELYERMQTLGSADPKNAAVNTESMQAIFGAEAGDWHVERVKKFDPKGVKLTPDKHGNLPVNPFNDVYLDNGRRELAVNYIALRTRKVKGEKNNFTQINYKPGPGVRDPRTNVARRIESELITIPEVGQDPSLLLPLLSAAHEPLNPHNLGNAYAMQARGRPLPASVPGNPTTEITQHSGVGSNRRYKFEFNNTKTLVAFEASLDLCATLATGPNGMPIRVDANGVPNPKGDYFAMSVFSQVEPEANHMAGVVGAKNAPALAPAATAPVAAPAASTAAASSTGTATATSSSGSMAPPTTYIHGLKDLNSNIFTTDPGYVQFDKVMPGFQQWLFKGAVGARDGAMPTEQKNSMGQRFAGTVPMSAQEQGLYGQEITASRQFREKASSKLMAVVEAAEKEIATATAKFAGRADGAAKVNEVTAKAREKVWAKFQELNPLDFIDLGKLPPP